MTLQLCRICGSNESLLNILEQGPAMLEKLSKFANIDIKYDDFLPKLICQRCDRILDMSYELRRQIETMQEKLQQELTERDDAEVHYISDDEVSKSECERKEVISVCLDHKEEVTLASTVTNAEAFMSIEQETFDIKNELTILASETEDVNELEEALKSTKESDCYVNQTFRPESADDIESNESYDVDMTKSLVPSTVPDKIISENVVDDEVVDIGDVKDEFMQDCHNTSSNSQFVSELEYRSIDSASNAGSRTRDVDHEIFGADSRSSASPYTCVTCNEVFTRKKDYHDHIEQHGTSRYQCFQCLAFFPTRYRLGRHKATHTDVSSYDCPHCNRQYTAGYNLKRHIKACHTKKNKYHCDICQLSYARRDVLKRHVLLIHTNKKWLCKACGERSASHLNAHNSICGIEKPPPSSNKNQKKDYHDHIEQQGASRYQCIQCLAFFPTRYRLVRHEATHTDVSSYDCPHCNRQYTAGYTLRRHIKASHLKKNKYHCDICQLSYARRDVLKRHVLLIHTNKKWLCKACGESFGSASHLNAHNSTCSIEKPPPTSNIVQVSDNRYKCIHCNALFKTLSLYRHHLLIHQDIRPFPCTTCPKAFRTRNALNNHERIHSNERPFKCEICLRSFRQLTHLKYHRYLHMKDDLPFNCTKCQMAFVTKWKLREHLRKHFTKRAFKCAECPQGFFLKYDLKRHARLVHNRSVDIVDSDNEDNRNNQLDFTEGTTEADKTDDDRHVENEMEEVELDDIDILDYDKYEEKDEEFLVLNEAEPPSPGDVREASKESIGNLGDTVMESIVKNTTNS